MIPARGKPASKVFEPKDFHDCTVHPHAPLSSALATVFRGKFCDVVLRNRPVSAFDKDQVIYSMGHEKQTLFFIRSGFMSRNNYGRWQLMVAPFCSGGAGGSAGLL